MFCTKCGKSIANGSLFCEYCGSPIGQVGQPAQQQIQYNAPAGNPNAQQGMQQGAQQNMQQSVPSVQQGMNREGRAEFLTKLTERGELIES